MADLTRVESFQYPAGHFAHLSDSQQKALDGFKEIISKEGYYTPAGTDGKADATHDDETLLRYLRARRFVPTEAFKQFKDTEDWRKQQDIDNLFNIIEAEEFEQTRKLYPQWLGRRDKRGIPIYLFEIAPLNSKNISSYEKLLSKAKTTSPKTATKDIRLFALYESLIRFILPLCSAIDRPHTETPVSQSNNIVDIQGVGLKQFWNLKSHMQNASVLATAHYPETLDRIFIVGAPAFFPTVWGWIKRWFDPMTVSKIFILSPNNVFPTLSQYIHPDDIPKKYGGNLDFEFGQMPIIEPAIQNAIKWESPNVQNGLNTFPIGPIRWEHGTNGEMKAIAVGHENGTPRNKLIFTIPNPVKIEKGDITSAAIRNTAIDGATTGVGTATQPVIDESQAATERPPSLSSSSDEPFTTPKGSPKHAPAADSVDTPVASSLSHETSLPLRAGTSETRYEQQHRTHAAGQLADGTPEAAVNNHGHGDKTVTMEPGTVGQAPKDVAVKPEEPPAPGYVEQAKQVAASATAVVTSTVGGAVGAVGSLVGAGGSAQKAVKEEPSKEKSPEQKKLDAQIETKEPPAVEGYLREQVKSGEKAKAQA